MNTAQNWALILPRKLLIFVVLMLSAAGCTQLTEEAVNSKKSQERASQNLDDYPGLVRVVVYGLAVFHFGADPPKATMPKGAQVLFAKAHGHKLKVWHGKKSPGSGKYRLEALDYEFDTSVPDMDNAGIEFQGPLESELRASIGNFKIEDIEDFPSQEQARDVRWMMRAINMDDFRSLRGGNVQATLQMPRGKIETCGLVHPPNQFGYACKVNAPKMSQERAASEYMLFSFTLAPDATELSMVVRKLNTSEIITFSATEEGPIEIDGKTYSRVFDLVMGNIGSESSRGVQSNHANHLKPLFVRPAGEWEVSVPGCGMAGKSWECGTGRCIQGIQPTCLSEFKNYVNWIRVAGNNRPICPMVEYP